MNELKASERLPGIFPSFRRIPPVQGPPGLSGAMPLGLQLVNNLVEQIDGDIKIDRNNGIKYKISFKELKYKERI